MKTYYYSDPHFGHAKIIEFCARPFPDVGAMDRFQMERLCEIDQRGDRLVILGDIAFHATEFLRRWQGAFMHPERHILISGNHDRDVGRLAPMFGTIIGVRRTWREHYHILDDTVDGRPCRVHLSHQPIADLRGCEWGLHGHTHNSATRQPERHWGEYPWLRGRADIMNVSAEVVDYQPRTLAWLVEQRTASSTALQ